MGLNLNYIIKLHNILGAVVVVYWSASLLSTPKIRVPSQLNPGPNPINVFSASIEAKLKFNQSARLKVVT